MAEAFGLAASAVGIVSLGLQVYEGLASYVEGVKERKPELAAISKQANNFQAIVKTLQVATPRIDAILKNNESPLFSTLKTVEEELWALKLFLGSLQDVSGQSSKIVSVLNEKKKKLVYPFHRPTLEKLQKRLESANSALQISLQVVNLTATTSINTTVSEIHTTVNSSQSSLMGIQSGIGSLGSSMASMATSLYPTQSSLESMEGKLDLLLTEGRTENGHLATNFQAVHTHVGHVSHKMQQTMSMVQMSTGAIHEGFQHHSGEISQLQDLVLKALSQSAAREMEMKEATEALNRKIITLSRLSDGTNTAANSSRPAVVLGRLLSKPSELKDAYEFNHVVASHASRQPEVASSAARQICPCQSRKITQYQVKKFGDFYTSRKTTTQSAHLPGCEFQSHDSEVTTHARTMSYTGFRRLLSLSLELSFSWTSGAGGLSISPNITLRPMVDEEKSPVFRLIGLLRENAQEIYETTCIEQKGTTLEQFLNDSVDSILKLYRSKTCSPYDVNHEGQSVLHQWVQLLWLIQLTIWVDFDHSNKMMTENHSLASGSSMRRLMAMLSPNGIMFDYYGNSPLDIFLKSQGGMGFALGYLIDLREVATELCLYDDEMTVRIHDSLKEDESIIQRKMLLFWHNTELNFPVMAEMMGLGPLSKSLMTGDKARLQSILDTDPTALEEKAFQFQTSFHLAALSSSPEPLKALLDAARDRSTQFDTQDRNGTYALEVAALTSSEICRNGRTYELCTDCACSLQFDMLQSSGWRLGSKSIVSPTSLLDKSSQSVRIKLISYVKRIRQELRAAALQYLSPYECRRLKLDNSHILDGHMQSVVKRLLEADLDIPNGYDDLVEDMLGGQKDCIYHDLVRSVYPNIESARLAELLFDSGFEDVDHENAYQETPLSALINDRSIEHYAELALWFIQHGAQMSRVIQGRNTCGMTVAHQILRLQDLSHLKRTEYSSIAEVISLVAPLRLSDECRCACNGSGCTTTTIFFQHLWDIFFRNNYELDLQHFQDVKSLLQSGKKNLIKSKPALDTDDNNDDSVSKKSRDLNHSDDIEVESDTVSRSETLGSESSWEYEEYEEYEEDEEEHDQSHFRQSARHLSIFLQLLEVDFVQWDHVSLSALKIFTFEALEMRHTCCHEMVYEYSFSKTRSWKDISPLCDEDIEEIQEEDHYWLCKLDDLIEEFVVELRNSGDTLQRFLIRYWAPRMEDVLDDLREVKMSPEDMVAAEQIGVTWESTSESEEDEESCPSSPTLSERFEAFMEEMDKIVATATQTDST